LSGARPRLLLAHSMGAAIALVCLRRHPRLFDAAILSSPMVGLRTGKLPPTLLRVITRPAPAAGAQPGLDRRRTLPHPSCLVFGRAGLAPRRGNLWLGRQRSCAGGTDQEAGISRRHPDAGSA